MVVGSGKSWESLVTPVSALRESSVARGTIDPNLCYEIRRSVSAFLSSAWVAHSKEHGSAAYRHPNGFFVFPLFEKGRGEPALRLHVHPGERYDKVSLEFHDHPWNLTSIVVAGVASTRLLKVGDGEDRYISYRCTRQNVGEAEVLQFDQKSVVLGTPSSVLKLSVGDYCHLPLEVPHSFHVSSLGAITVVLRDRYARAWTTIFVKEEADEGRYKSARQREYLRESDFGPILEVAGALLECG